MSLRQYLRSEPDSHNTVNILPMTIPHAFQLAVQRHVAGQFAQAEEIYRQVLAMAPGYAEAHSNLGDVLREQGRFDEAIAACRRATELRPDDAEMHSNLGHALWAGGRLDEAVAACRRAIQLQPQFAEAYTNLGNALRDQGQLDEAIAAYRTTVQLRPDYAGACNNLGNALRDQGHPQEAMAALRRATDLNPGFAEAHWNTSLLLLLSGDFERGWPLYENRWSGSDLRTFERSFTQPRWRGEPLQGQRVLVHAEQGLGDTLQFIRYAPLVAERGGQVIVECQPGLKALLTGLPGIAQVIERGEPWPAFDLQIPMLSLPLAFGTRVKTIPASVPYLRADAQKAARWRARLEQDHEKADDLSKRHPLKVGLVWAGGEPSDRPQQRAMNQRRSLRLSQLAPLAAVPGVIFVSLQKGDPVAQAKTPPEGMRLLDWTDELADFSDTAALVENLDLVISVDTAVAHLAGALGKPVWLLNRFDTCWRWLLGREDSPWYPTMRIFRQPRWMDWEPVIQSVAVELGRTVKARATTASEKT